MNYAIFMEDLLFGANFIIITAYLMQFNDCSLELIIAANIKACYLSSLEESASFIGDLDLVL